LALEESLAAFRLAVARILDLDPARASIVGKVGPGFPLRDDALESQLADLFKQSRSVLVEMIEVQHARVAAPADEFSQFLLPIQKRQCPQILPVQPDEIEG